MATVGGGRQRVKISQNPATSALRVSQVEWVGIPGACPGTALGGREGKAAASNRWDVANQRDLTSGVWDRAARAAAGWLDRVFEGSELQLLPRVSSSLSTPFVDTASDSSSCRR